jgi:serine/threonine protein kinase
MSDIEDHL